MLHHRDNVGSVATAGAFGVVRVDSTVLESSNGLLDKARLVESVSVDKALDIKLIADGQAGVDGSRCASPVLVKLKTTGTSVDLLAKSLRGRIVSFAGDTDVDREGVTGLKHLTHVVRSRCACRCVCSGAVGMVRQIVTVLIPKKGRSMTNLGPVPPPNIVVTPDARASGTCWGHIKCICVSIAPAVMILPSPAITSVQLPTTMLGAIPSITSGFPAFPIPTIMPSLIPISAL